MTNEGKVVHLDHVVERINRSTTVADDCLMFQARINARAKEGYDLHSWNWCECAEGWYIIAVYKKRSQP